MFGKNGKEKAIAKVVLIDCERIVPNPRQPRTQFDEEKLAELSESIQQNGLLQPLTVRRVEDGYELISGERRLRATKLAGIPNVPCIIMDANERSSAIMALIENIQRSQLTFFEEAAAIRRLIEYYGMTQEDAALKLGKAQSTIANKLRLLRLSEREQALITQYGLTERHARELLRLPEEEQRMYAIERIHSQEMNVSDTEELVTSLLETHEEIVRPYRRVALVRDVRLFVNTINKAIQTMRCAGIPADTKKSENDDYIEYVVRIPISSARREQVPEQTVIQSASTVQVKSGAV